MQMDTNQPDVFVLDACALIAYLTDEPGADKIQYLLDQARESRVHLYVASVNVYEVFYDCLKRDAAKAGELIEDIYSLPITIVESLTPSLMYVAGWFKVTYRVSLADSIALGLAQKLGARLASTDHHELDQIEREGKMRFYWLR